MGYPGDVKELKHNNNRCDEHPERVAKYRVQGETDSFGCEWLFMCDECYTEFSNKPEKKVIDTCEWCRTENVEVFPRRDVDEGSNGPIYDVCRACIQKDEKSLQEELDRYDDL